MSIRTLLIAGSILTTLGATAAEAATVENTSLANINGAYGGGTAITTTTSSGTVTTVTGPGGGANRADAPITYDTWAQHNVGGNASIGITTNLARSGDGSLEFNGLNGSSKADLEYYLSTPMSLSSFVSASYDWFRDSASTNPSGQVTSFRFLVNNASFSLNPSTALIFEPIYTAQATSGNPLYVAPTDSWQTSNITLDSIFWNNQPLSGTPGSPTFQSLASFISQDPGLLVYGFSTGEGSGFSGLYHGAEDNISYNFGAAGSNTFNFEVAAIPEPATWAMMLFGFGGLGAALRRRRVTATTPAVA